MISSAVIRVEISIRRLLPFKKMNAVLNSEKAADNHALIRSYIETCRRNHINEIDALNRLCAGNPYSVGENFLLQIHECKN